VSAAGSFLHTLQNELGGSIPVERFMAEALYNPAFGYYSTRIHSVGRHGDFSTMATLDQSLAHRIATWIQTEKCRDVIEIGKALDREGFAVRAGHHCAQPSLRHFGLEATVRPSLAFYNTHDEIDRLAHAITRIARM
jgi:hypothetical protein